MLTNKRLQLYTLAELSTDQNQSNKDSNIKRMNAGPIRPTTNSPRNQKRKHRYSNLTLGRTTEKNCESGKCIGRPPL